MVPIGPGPFDDPLYSWSEASTGPKMHAHPDLDQTAFPKRQETASGQGSSPGVPLQGGTPCSGHTCRPEHWSNSSYSKGVDISWTRRPGVCPSESQGRKDRCQGGKTRSGRDSSSFGPQMSGGPELTPLCSCPRETLSCFMWSSFVLYASFCHYHSWCQPWPSR